MPDTQDEAGEIVRAVQAGCNAAGLHLACTYPDCSCKQTPVIAKAAISAQRSVEATEEEVLAAFGGRYAASCGCCSTVKMKLARANLRIVKKEP